MIGGVETRGLGRAAQNCARCEPAQTSMGRPLEELTPRNMAMPQPFNPGNLIRFNARCPICQSAYDMQKLKILGEREQQLLAYIDCTTCSTAMLTILSLGPSGMSAQGVVTDLSVDEIVESDAWERISTNDVLDIHEFLESDRLPYDGHRIT